MLWLWRGILRPWLLKLRGRRRALKLWLLE
jgi:hypothetical protein